MNRNRLSKISFWLPVLGWAAAFFWILAGQSEEKNAWLLGYSKARIGMAVFALLMGGLAYLIGRSEKNFRPFLWLFSGILLIGCDEILLFSRFPSDDSRNLIPLIAARGLPLLVAFIFSAVCWLAGILFAGTKAPKAAWLVLFCFSVFCYWMISSHMNRALWSIRLDGNSGICISILLSALFWYLMIHSGLPRVWKTFAGGIFFSVLAFGVTRLTGMWMGRNNTPSSAYWGELAESMLAGRLDLPHPTGTHDLTLYEGKWFVPNPPLPGILLIPWVALKGSAEAVNTCMYSAVLTGLSAGLIFLTLILSYTKKGGPLYQNAENPYSYPENCLKVSGWVTVLFVFGSDILWLGTTGQMWFISQLLVVLFTLLACICVICGFSPVWAGISLGLGVLCRPNIFPVFLCLLGLWLYQKKNFPEFDLKETIIWGLKCGMPVVVSVGLLLLYNKVRFDDWMDFGYVTINGADWIMESVTQWGMFHPHFISINARVMFLGLPRLDFSGERFFFYPYTTGYSIFLMMPPLIYIFRTFRKNWYVVGTWASVLLTTGLLLMYHNNGSEQIGFRYLLDMAAPLVLLVADGTHGKISRLFKILTVFAIVLEFIAIYWWYLGRV